MLHWLFKCGQITKCSFIGKKFYLHQLEGHSHTTHQLQVRGVCILRLLLNLRYEKTWSFANREFMFILSSSMHGFPAIIQIFCQNSRFLKTKDRGLGFEYFKLQPFVAVLLIYFRVFSIKQIYSSWLVRNLIISVIDVNISLHS